VAVYGPFKTYFEVEINKFQKEYPCRVICQYDIAKLASQAYLKAARPQNTIKAFGQLEYNLLIDMPLGITVLLHLIFTVQNYQLKNTIITITV
jgi:hypothetical protein